MPPALVVTNWRNSSGLSSTNKIFPRQLHTFIERLITTKSGTKVVEEVERTVFALYRIRCWLKWPLLLKTVLRE